MLVGVKVALKLWLIILKSRVKLEKIFKNKNCAKKGNLFFLFYNLSSQMKGWKDIKAVRFEFEFTSYRTSSKFRKSYMPPAARIRVKNNFSGFFFVLNTCF
jgi:hypothetical protein